MSRRAAAPAAGGRQGLGQGRGHGARARARFRAIARCMHPRCTVARRSGRAACNAAMAACQRLSSAASASAGKRSAQLGRGRGSGGGGGWVQGRAQRVFY